MVIWKNGIYKVIAEWNMITSNFPAIRYDMAVERLCILNVYCTSLSAELC